MHPQSDNTAHWHSAALFILVVNIVSHFIQQIRVDLGQLVSKHTALFCEHSFI